MEKICRFCLKVSIKMCTLQECDILYNIQKFLLIKIPTEDSFPSNLCKECFIKISQIIKFCLTVKDNEDKLQYYSRIGLLQDYYSKITNIQQMMKERKDEKIETHYNLKVEDNTNFGDYDHLKNYEMSDDINETHYSSDDEITLSSIKKKEQDYYSEITNIQQIKDEQIETHYIVKVEDNRNFGDYDHSKNYELSDDINDTHNSSNDEITLSSIKKENELNPTAPLKNITKFIPIKSIIPKRRKLKQPENVEYVKPFTCLTCLIECNSQADLTKHYYAEHVKKETGHKNYREHKSEDKTTYSCNSCDQICDLKKDIVKHSKSHNVDEKDERPLICKLCARTYRRVPDIVRHARAHNGIKLQCPYNCGYTTAYAGAMKDHKSRHLDEYKYTCKTCGKGFNTKTWYEQHQNLHTGQKPFVCNICGVAFPLARYLQTHKSSLHPQSSSLKRYQCLHCGEKCDSTKSLALHLRKHGINKETRSLCDFCGKIVTSTYQLQYHHRMHLGVKPYSCTICKKKFAKKYNVQLHMSIHTGDKSHVCVHCGKQYSQRSTLLRHLKRYHDGAGDTST